MSRLVIRHLSTDLPGKGCFSLEPCHHPLDGEIEVGHGNRFPLAPHRQKGGLVGDVGQIRAGKPRRDLGESLQADILAKGHFPSVDSEDLQAP